MKNLQRNIFGAIAVIYCLGMVYQLFLVTDFQMNREQIIQEHCENVDKPELHCNGKCHLKKEIEKITPPTEAADETTNNFSASLFFVPFSQTLIYKKMCVCKTDVVKPVFSVSSSLVNTVLEIDLPPPRVIC